MKIFATIFAIIAMFVTVCLCVAPLLMFGSAAEVTAAQTVAGVLAGWTGAAVFAEF